MLFHVHFARYFVAGDSFRSDTPFRNLAEMLSNHLKKGQMVFVQGDLNVRQYTTRDGRNGISLDVTIEKFQFAGGKKEETVTPADTSNEDPLKDLEDHPF